VGERQTDLETWLAERGALPAVHIGIGLRTRRSPQGRTLCGAAVGPTDVSLRDVQTAASRRALRAAGGCWVCLREAAGLRIALKR